ncbi:AP5B1 [Branchiostoma lanceolatum]|uniref:AP-5 complex subunit beta-1 n=1 Tax=Branchiostoma lanceolatum TaxID=7740 RepID=A0A8K0EKV6_BRALA|nr:AP5B1 [Branchiostoma lanceolatum]
MAGSGITAQGEQWLREMDTFRANPTVYLVGKRMDEEGFVLDVLQALYSDELSNTMKVQLLGLLQEKCGVLLNTNTSVEQAVGSLTGIFQQAAVDTAGFFKGQVLVAITTILIARDQLVEQPQLVGEFLNTLLEVVSKVNSGPDQVLRGVACECLREMEMSYPGVLMRKVGHLYAMCQTENTYVGQSYMMLFVSVLKNAMQSIIQETEVTEKTQLSELLAGRVEPFKPICLPDNVDSNTFPLLQKERDETSSADTKGLESKELKSVISVVVEHLPLLTSAGKAFVLRQLISCVDMSPDLSASTFKSQFLNHVATTDIGLLHTVLQLKSQFGPDLLSDVDEDLLLRRLLTFANHPCVAVLQRLLCWHWILHYTTDKQTSGEVIPARLYGPLVSQLFPQVFDHMTEMVTKLRAVSLYYATNTPPDSSLQVLIDSLVCVQKSVQQGVEGQSAQVLFQALFQYYRQHHSPALAAEIQRLLLDVVLFHPKFVAHTIDLLDSVEELTPDSPMPVEILGALVNHTVKSSPRDVIADLEHYMMILEKAASMTQIDPKPSVLYLLTLLQTTPLCEEGSWHRGHALLSVCAAVMRNHPTTHYFKEMGDVLYTMLTLYDDLDVRDQARLYYTLLTNLSFDKLSSLLAVSADTRAHTATSLTKLVTGGSTFPPAAPVVQITQPLLKLTRVPEDPTTMLKLEGAEEVLINEKDLLPAYLGRIQASTYQPAIHMKYYLHFDTEADPDYSRLYALVLHVETNNKFVQVKDTYVSCISREDSVKPENGCKTVTLSFQPLEPVPTQFIISCEFSTEDGKTFAGHLPVLQLVFRDLFLPLPVPGSQKLQLAQQLWEHIHLQQQQAAGDSQENAPENGCVESVCCLTVGSEAVDGMLRRELGPFLVKQEDDEHLIGILLPPRTHLLMKVKTTDSAAVITMATDNWRILPLVNSYLHGLEKSGA